MPVGGAWSKRGSVSCTQWKVVRIGNLGNSQDLVDVVV